MSKTGFNDPIAAKPPKAGKKTPWSFDCPKYDDRTQIRAGSTWGVGHKNPVGHEGNPKKEAATLPFGRPKTLSVHEHSELVDLEQ